MAMPQRDDPPTPRLRRTRTSSARLSARSRTTCQAVASRVISSNVSDYRNPIIAEAMKVLGYVNCYNRGINMVQDELEANGNGKAEISFKLITAFEAKVAKAGQQQELDQFKQDSSMKSSMKSGMKSDNRLLLVLKDDPTMSLPKMAEAIGLSVAGVRKVLDKLRATGRIRRIGPDKGGRWEVVNGEGK